MLGSCFLTWKEGTSRFKGTKTQRAVPKVLQKIQMRFEEENMEASTCHNALQRTSPRWPSLSEPAEARGAERTKDYEN